MTTQNRLLVPLFAFAFFAVAIIAALSTALFMGSGAGTAPLKASPVSSSGAVGESVISAASDALSCDWGSAGPQGSKGSSAPKKSNSHKHHKGADGKDYVTFTVIEGNEIKTYTVQVQGDLYIQNTAIEVDIDGDGNVDVLVGNHNNVGNVVGSGNTAINISDNNVGNEFTNINIEDNNVGNEFTNVSDNNVGNEFTNIEDNNVGNTNIEDNVVIADNEVGNTDIEDSGNGNVIGNDDNNIGNDGNVVGNDDNVIGNDDNTVVDVEIEDNLNGNTVNPLPAP